MFVNWSSSPPPRRASEKLFEIFKEDVYRAVSQLIAANEDRPEFLINLFQELQMLPPNDPLRARLMQAFDQLDRRQGGAGFAGEREPQYAEMVSEL